MNVLALCAGIGGLELGLRIRNPSTRCICYVEGETYAASVLVKRMEEGWLDQAPIWSDVNTFDGRPWNKIVDCIAGGYPCQPFSSLGKKLGKSDERWLWESIKRIIGEVGPEWCFFENVSAHLRVGFEQVHDDLCSMGYKVASGLFKATEVGAGHSRERLFLLAHSVSKRRERTVERESICLDETSDSSFSKECTIGRLAHAFDNGGAIMGSEASEYPMDLGFPPRPDSELWRNIGDRFSPAKIIESNILGMANGLAATMDSLRCSGNAVCPLVAAYAFHILQTNFELSPETIKPPI